MSMYVYIDTRPGKGLFSAPKGEPDYPAWVLNKYNKQHYVDGENKCCFGLAQKTHEMIQKVEPQTIVIIGLHACDLAKFFMQQANELGKNLEIEVISGS